MRYRRWGRPLLAAVACLTLSGCGQFGFVLSDDFADPELVVNVPTAYQPLGSPDVFSALLRQRFPIGSPDILLIQQLRNEGFVVPPGLVLEGVYVNRKRRAAKYEANYAFVFFCGYNNYDVYWAIDDQDRITAISGAANGGGC